MPLYFALLHLALPFVSLSGHESPHEPSIHKRLLGHLTTVSSQAHLQFFYYFKEHTLIDNLSCPLFHALHHEFFCQICPFSASIFTTQTWSTLTQAFSPCHHFPSGAAVPYLSISMTCHLFTYLSQKHFPSLPRSFISLSFCQTIYIQRGFT